MFKTSRNRNSVKIVLDFTGFLRILGNNSAIPFLTAAEKRHFYPSKLPALRAEVDGLAQEKRQAFLLPCRLRLLPLPKFARRRPSFALAIPATLPHVGATSGLRASGGYAPGCVRKIGHSRDTRLTRADRRFSAAPVGTLPTAFGCVPAHIPRPALQAFARKTAGWRTEWAGACTEDSRFVFDHPA